MVETKMKLLMTQYEVPFNIVQYKYLKTKYVLLEYSIDVNYKVMIIMTNL